MSRPGPETMAKRQREREKAEKRRAKQEKRALRRARKNGQLEEPLAANGTDPEFSRREPAEVDPMGPPSGNRETLTQ